MIWLGAFIAKIGAGVAEYFIESYVARKLKGIFKKKP